MSGMAHAGGLLAAARVPWPVPVLDTAGLAALDVSP